ncbi:hypothetical protein HDU96_000583 [Phlyctochytrium bullatum]|nr:hypothetical protein HDU96_000583 [Phlyctochytrium bullatum]
MEETGEVDVVDDDESFNPIDILSQEGVKGILDAHAKKPLPEFLAAKTTVNVKVLLEVGCGVGNFVWPLLESTSNLFVAIELAEANEKYDRARCHVFVCDLTKDPLTDVIKSSSVDFVSSIFCLSAIPPLKLLAALTNIAQCLKPGGVLFIRDYGVADQAELRFKPGRMIEPHFYARQDGTFSVYFTLERLQELLEEAGFEVEESKYVTRRIENRKLELVMSRVWVQVKARRRPL